ncbi:transmembrane protein 131 homolog [Musca vetustissima]|uniref:transmembrane protein 131 homolog n=1 Tax=Musca vetustissima TaxID=27455 RepID=UPI002AB7B11C|nr:transmembrane protein 131 homolog [Musca vetustissima]
MLVLAFLTTTLCGFADVVAASEVDISISENSNTAANLKHDDGHHLETQSAAATATLQDITDTGGGGGSGSVMGIPDSGDLNAELLNRLRFIPSQLDFGELSVGTVQSHTVTLVNQNRNHSVYLSLVTGGTPSFYSSLFEAKTVPPNGNTTFDVVFLPRENGAVRSNLFLHTSFGKLLLMVSGEVRECPYRLKPLVGIRAPLNATLMPMIHMYNPHERALQILEIYSSGGKFKLELPSGDSEGPHGLWEIPPYSTKPIIGIRFQGYTAGKHSAYIRIKIAEPTSQKQILVIPVEFVILSEYGIYAVNPVIDFGYIALDDKQQQPIKQKLYLRHSKHQLDIQNLEFESLTLTKAAASSSATSGHTYHNVELIVRANVYKGSLYYDRKSTLFLDRELRWNSSSSQRCDNATSDEALSHLKCTNLGEPRHIVLRNDYQIPLLIYNITTGFNESSKLNLYLQQNPLLQKGESESDAVVVLQPADTMELTVAFRLATTTQQNPVEQPEEDLKDLLRNYKTAIYVYTNISNPIQIPIVVSSTSLFVTTQTSSLWRSKNSVYTKEIQIISSAPLRDISHKGYIVLQNRNSIPINLNNWDFQKTSGIYYAVKFAGSIRAMDINESNDYAIDLEKHSYRLDSVLEEGDVAVFEVALMPYSISGTAYLSIATSYENITVTLNFDVVFGKLEVDQEKLHFANCFPGKICSSELSIRSSFDQAIHMKHINFSDPGLRFVDRSSKGSIISPNSVTTVGRIYFEPSALCGNRCYIPQHTDESTTFPHSPQVDKILNMPHFDEVELRRRTELYRHFKSYFQNLDFIMTTKQEENFHLNLMIEIQWPQLIPTRQVIPTVEVNKTQVFEVKISNPSDKPILIDYSLADPKLAHQTQFTLPLEVIIITPTCYLTDKAVFSLVNPAPSKPILIPGLTSIRVPITFKASSMGSYCTLLHIRNNLTLYEGTWISAKAVQSHFRLGNRKPGSPTPLLFEITEQQLTAACPSKEDKPSIISRRVFTARNSGELPIWIDSIWIGDQPCRGYGFQIMDCKSFELKANSTKTIEIQFQTDFTATRITKPLTLRTNLTYAVNYVLVAQLPSKGLEQCTSLLPRPPWEEKIRNATIIMLIITFVLVLIAVHIDYGNIMYTQATLYGAREKGTIHPTFNLRNIAMRQNNNESSPTGDVEMTLKNKSGLKKRNNVGGGKNQRMANGEAIVSSSSSSSSSFSALPNMTLAEMVSWTFGSKTSRKANKLNKNKEATVATPTPSASSNVTTTTNSSPASNDVKNCKNKLTEKSLVEKMDEDLKKAQPTVSVKKPTKVTEKIASKPRDEEVKQSKEDVPPTNKEVKKENKALTKNTTNKNTSSPEPMPSKEQRRSLDSTSSNTTHSDPSTMRQVKTPPPVSIPSSGPTVNTNKVSPTTTTSHVMPMTEITNHQTPISKETTNGRKLGKTPGRERRKQTTQNTSPTTSSCSSASTSSTSSSSIPQHQQPQQQHNTAKRFERKPKSRVSNSLKFPTQNFSHANSVYSQMAAAANDHNDQTFHQDVLSPWDYSSHITFSDVLQQTQQFANAQSNANANSTGTTLLNSDLKMFDNPTSTASPTPSTASSGPINLPFAASPLEFNDGPSKTDLGPIGSRKSPSSTPAWETLNSAITLQLPRPLNTTLTTTSQPPPPPSLPYDLHSCPNYGLNDLLTARQTIQQIAAANAAQFLLQQQQQQLQQQQHYLNFNQSALNNNWSSANTATSSSGWTPFLGNGVADLSPTLPSHSNADIFGGAVTSTSTWSTTPASSSIEQHFVNSQQFPMNTDVPITNTHNGGVYVR